MILNLTEELQDTEKYRASIFPGGEIYFALKDIALRQLDKHTGDVYVRCRINSANALMLLIMAINTVKSRNPECKIYVYLCYIPYQQSDRHIYNKKKKELECFGLKAVADILNELPVYRYTVVDPHSDVAPALIKNCLVVDNSDFIGKVLTKITTKNLTILSPDAGAYKKIFKLCSDLELKD